MCNVSGMFKIIADLIDSLMFESEEYQKVLIEFKIVLDQFVDHCEKNQIIEEFIENRTAEAFNELMTNCELLKKNELKYKPYKVANFVNLKEEEE